MKRNMNDRLIQKIIAGKIPCYFISPHLDDAIFSAGGLIAHLSRHALVEVVTVFTNASPRPYTLSAEAFLKQCKYIDADTLFADRRKEDIHACALAGIMPRHVGHVDALWRKISSPHLLRRMLSRMLPEFLHVYPTYRLHIIRGGVSAHDASLSHRLGEKLREIVGLKKEYVLFCPLALRSHIDHVLVRDVCLANFDTVIMWRDFPYTIRNSIDSSETSVLGDEVFQWDAEKSMKEKMMRSYTSQMLAMFPDGNIPFVPEAYYAPRMGKSTL
jgi:LmbE family N-acetylglucosaminyl deacetylase